TASSGIRRGPQGASVGRRRSTSRSSSKCSSTPTWRACGRPRFPSGSMARMSGGQARHLIVDNVDIGDDFDCYVIAEVGHNHQGELAQAKRLIDAAKDCGANAVKLQKRSNRTLYTREFYEQPYDNELSFGHTYGEHREALELGAYEYRELLTYARERDITLFATAFDFESADLLAELDVA